MKRLKNNNTEFLYKDMTYQLIGCCYEVYNVIGYGFLEKVYCNALIEELKLNKVKTEIEVPIKVYYKDKNVGDYRADIVIENKIILEIKAEKTYNPNHEAQLINYLKATGFKVGYLINFGQDKLEFKRIVN